MSNETASENTEKSLREELEANLSEVQERLSDDDGKFETAEETEPVEVEDSADEDEQAESGEQEEAEEESVPEFEPPNSWKSEAKEHWKNIPPDLQKYITDREAEIHKGFTRQDEERNFGKQIREIVNPYMPLIQSEGADPQMAIQSLLNTAYVLRTAPPEQKAQLIKQLVQQYNIPMDGLAQEESYVDPAVETLQQRLDRLEQERQMEFYQRQQMESQTIESSLNAFAAKEGHEHFDKVSQHMGALISAGLVEGSTPDEVLEKAYEQAVWARPDLRSTLLTQEKQSEQAKRAEAAKAKAQAARKASGSLKGSPSGRTETPKTERSLREELREQLRAASN